MQYLERLETRPRLSELDEADRKIIEARVKIDRNDIAIDGQRFELHKVDHVEVAVAARQSSPAGWLVKKVLYGGDRYHVGVYSGREEMIVTNISLAAATYIVQSVAHFAGVNIRYSGVEGVTPVYESGEG